MLCCKGLFTSINYLCWQLVDVTFWASRYLVLDPLQIVYVTLNGNAPLLALGHVTHKGKHNLPMSKVCGPCLVALLDWYIWSFDHITFLLAQIENSITNRTHNTTNPAETMQPKWKSRNNAHIMPTFDCITFFNNFLLFSMSHGH